MNKISVAIFIFFFVLINLKAQYLAPRETPIDKYEILDSAYIEFSYELHYLKDTTKSKNVSEDIKVLQIGKHISKFYSYYVLKYDSVIQELIKKGNDFVPNNPKSGAQGYEIFKNYPNGKLTYTDKGTCLFDNFIYEEDVPVFKWKLISDKVMLLDHPCQKATTSFRGRDYEAWFAADIPIPDGPWKFSGLPGLILKVQDVQQNFIFECISIHPLKAIKTPILFYKIDYLKTKREDLAKLYQRYHNDPTGYNESLGKKLMFMGKDGQPKVNRSFKFPYNPIELE